MPGSPPSPRLPWREALLEALGLGLFMFAAVAFTVLLEWPGSPLRAAMPDPLARRGLMGLAMGGTAIGLIYSPWGKRSGAHLNPSVTLAFLRLGKLGPAHALSYVAFQFLGGVAGVALAAALLGGAASDPAVRHAVTVPGPSGVGAAFAAEAAISFLLMSVVLLVSNSGWSRFTGICAGLLVATYISFEAPISGMSMNPARTVGSAAGEGLWDSLWIYFTAPPLGMLLAAEAYLRLRGLRAVHCAKLHPDRGPCVFRCGAAAAA